MDRRKFVQLSLVGAAAMSLPMLNCRNAAFSNPLAYPEGLANICDDNTIRDIGVAYRKQVAVAQNIKELEKLLLVDIKGNPFPVTAEKSAITEMLKQKVLNDFRTGSIVFVRGWVLSLTEARQCALFALTFN